MKTKTLFKTMTLVGWLIGLAVGFALVLLFPMNPAKIQGWFAGLLQGVFWFFNWVVSWFKETWYVHAPLCGKGYNFWFWFGVVGNVIGVVWNWLGTITRYRQMD